MKTYARIRNPYKKTFNKNVMLGVSNQQYMNMIDWKNKGYIAKDKNIPYLHKEYIEIKNELKAKGLIQ